MNSEIIQEDEEKDMITRSIQILQEQILEKKTGKTGKSLTQAVSSVDCFCAWNEACNDLAKDFREQNLEGSALEALSRKIKFKQE